MGDMLKNISAASGEQWRRESIRHGGGKGGEGGLVLGSDGLEKIGRRVFWYDGTETGNTQFFWQQQKTIEGEKGHRTEVGEVGAGPISKLRNNKRRSLGLEW